MQLYALASVSEVLFCPIDLSGPFPSQCSTVLISIVYDEWVPGRTRLYSFSKALVHLGPLYFHKKYGVILSIPWKYDICHILYHIAVVSTWNTEFIPVLLFINYCIIFHMNNCKPAFAQPCRLWLVWFNIGITDLFSIVPIYLGL